MVCEVHPFLEHGLKASKVTIMAWVAGAVLFCSGISALDLTFVAVAYDSWKRMEMVRLASEHMRRKKFKQSSRAVTQCTSESLGRAMQLLGEGANFKDILRSRTVNDAVGDAVQQLMLFSAEVLGADGARQQLRHEQNGAMLRPRPQSCARFVASALNFGLRAGFGGSNPRDRIWAISALKAVGGAMRFGFLCLVVSEPS